MLWEPLSYLALEYSLGEGNGVLQLQNGRLIWTDICSRERRGEKKEKDTFNELSLILGDTDTLSLLGQIFITSQPSSVNPERAA